MAYISLMSNTTSTMTTITLTLAPHEESRLLDAINDEVSKWRNIGLDVLSGKRPNASYEGAQMLEADAKAVRSAIIEQIVANRPVG